MRLNLLLWALYAAYLAAVVGFGWTERTLALDGALGRGKLVVWIVLLAFLAYSYHCSLRESLFRSVREILKLRWGRQIGLDLYIGFVLMWCLVYLHEGDAAVAALYLLPVLAFGNLATLPYLAIHYDAIVARFVA